MPSFEAALDRYARYLVEQASDLTPGCRLDVGAETGHRDLALRIGDAAYAAGASQVSYRFFDPSVAVQLIRLASPEQLARHSLDVQAHLTDILRGRGALILLEGRTDPDLLEETASSYPSNHQRFAAGISTVSLGFQRWSTGHGLCSVVSAVCPTQAWSRRVFPGLEADAAYRRLWEHVLHFTFCDHADAGERAARELHRLETRAKALDQLGIRELRIRGGGNDLVIGLSEWSRFATGEAGFNRSDVHLDVAFGSPEVDVVAICRGGRVPVLMRGLWV